jgi:hypothetical protein
LRSVHADPLALLVQDFFLIAPASSNSTLLGRVAGEERTRGEGLLASSLRASLGRQAKEEISPKTPPRGFGPFARVAPRKLKSAATNPLTTIHQSDRFPCHIAIASTRTISTHHQHYVEPTLKAHGYRLFALASSDSAFGSAIASCLPAPQAWLSSD